MSAGVFFVGDQEVIDEIAHAANVICRKKHDDSKTVHETMKQCFTDDKEALTVYRELVKVCNCDKERCNFLHMDKNGSLKNYPTLRRKQRTSFFESKGVAGYLADLEFIHIKSVPMRVPPGSVDIDNNTREYIFKQQESYLGGTVFADCLCEEVGVGDLIQPVYEHYSTIECLKDKYYLIGVEPLSINSCLSGYRSCANISMTNGGRQENDLSTAKKESKEEFHINVDDVLDNENYERVLKEQGIDSQKSFIVPKFNKTANIFICLCLKDNIEVRKEENMVVLTWKGDLASQLDSLSLNK